jgi:hypothetical protein
LSGLFKNDFSSYRDIFHNLPDLQHIIMAAVNGKIRPADLGKMISSLKKVSDKLDRLSVNFTEEERRSLPKLLGRIFATMTRHFSRLKILIDQGPYSQYFIMEPLPKGKDQ